MTQKNNSLIKKYELAGLSLLFLVSSSFGGLIVSSGDAPSPVDPEIMLYSQAEGIDSGKVLSFKKLYKDVQAYPDDGSVAVLLTFTIDGAHIYSLNSITFRIDEQFGIGLNDDAFIEATIYRNDDPADSDFLSSEALSSGERFDASGFSANPGDYITLSFDDEYLLQGGVQHGLVLHWTVDSVAPDSIDIDVLKFRIARTVSLDAIPDEGFKLLQPKDMVTTSFPPDISGFSADDPILFVTGELYQEVISWAGYPAISLESQYVDTGNWLGMVFVEGDWIYIFDAEQWVYAPDPGENASGTWAFVVN